MIFRKNVRAGTLLYALLMMGIFALLLQFYIQSQLAAGYAWQAKKLEGQAYFMAQIVRNDYLKTREDGQENSPSAKNKEGEKQDDQIKETDSNAQTTTSGQVVFTAGQAGYEIKDQHLLVHIQLKSGQTYVYQFSIPSQN